MIIFVKQCSSFKSHARFLTYSVPGQEQQRMQAWSPVVLQASLPFENGVTRTSFCVSQAILEREGPASYFAAHMRFSPNNPIDLGRLDRSVKVPLELYLTSGIMSALKRDVSALHYAADRFLLQRLKSLLPREASASENSSRLQCLNCRDYIPSEERRQVCHYKPPRRHASCSKCGLTNRECRCVESMSRHVFDTEAPPDAYTPFA